MSRVQTRTWTVRLESKSFFIVGRGKIIFHLTRQVIPNLFQSDRLHSDFPSPNPMETWLTNSGWRLILSAFGSGHAALDFKLIADIPYSDVMKCKRVKRRKGHVFKLQGAGICWWMWSLMDRSKQQISRILTNIRTPFGNIIISLFSLYQLP